LAKPSQRQRGGEGDEHDRVDRALLVGALHQAQRLERDDRRSGDVRIGCSKVADEAPRAVAVPDVDGGMDLQQEASGVAHELGPKLRRHVGEADLAGDEVVLKPLEALDEIAVERSEERRVGKKGGEMWWGND